MGKLNEIQEQTTQSWGDNSFTTSIKVDTVEFDSAKDSFTFNDPVEVPGLRINGTEIVAFDAEDRTKLDSLQTTMQIKGRVDGVGDLPTEDVKVGDVYLVGLSGDGNFEEYVCVEVSGSPVTPVWENLGHVKVQSDWNQSNNSSDNYIKNKPAINAGQGVKSIIEGANTTASGNYSHAEGSGTQATGAVSHAEGESTKAEGMKSHAEGAGTTASGYCSHAEGAGTTASENSAHAEGQATTASGSVSHAEGSGTQATGAVSHAEGANTTASGDNSHAEGSGTQATNYGSHSEGSGAKATGAMSHAEGQSTTASGTSSHAEGGQTTSTGDYSHTEGKGTIANNKSQHVFGEYNGVDPSSALSSARGTYVEIVGNGTTNTNRSNARTLDWGGNENLQGNLTIGGTITANGQQILPQKQADWKQTTSTGSDYIKNKPAIKAGQGVNSIIEGDIDNNVASGDNSHAEGQATRASVACSHAEGGSTTASGSTSHAEGGGTTASGSQSHAEGGGTTASGPQSHAEGGGTTASGSTSHAEGSGTIANHKSQHVFGECNIADPSLNGPNTRGDYIEIVGNGTTNTNRSNARTLDWSGNETLAGNLTIGGTITANGVKTNKITIVGINPADEYMYSEIIDASSDVVFTRVLAGTSPTKTDGYVEILYKATTGVTCSAYIDSADVALTVDGAWHKLEQGCNPGHGVEIHVNNSAPVTGATLEVISKVYYI